MILFPSAEAIFLPLVLWIIRTGESDRFSQLTTLHCAAKVRERK